jgi:hypothetical protein
LIFSVKPRQSVAEQAVTVNCGLRQTQTRIAGGLFIESARQDTHLFVFGTRAITAALRTKPSPRACRKQKGKLLVEPALL